MKITLKILLFAAAIGLVGCTTTSTLPKELATDGIPKFDGYVTPIKIPVLLRYKPTDLRFKASMAVHTYVGRKTGKFHIEITSKSKIRNLGDLLIEDIVFEKFVIDGKTLPEFSGLVGRSLMDARGNIQEMELVGIASNEKEQKEVEEMIETMKHIPILPEMPVRSGDHWKNRIPRSLIEEDTSAELTPTELFEGLFEYTVDGWSIVNGRNLMVTSIDKMITERMDGEDYQIAVNGYQLWDSETAQQLESHILMTMVPTNHSAILIKIFLHATRF